MRRVLGILEDWKAAEGALKKAAAGAGKSRPKRQPLKKTKLLAPVQFPSAIYCAGANYADHAAAMAASEGQPAPPDPHDAGAQALALHQGVARPSPIRARRSKSPTTPSTMDWEIELAAVIGRPAKDVPLNKALSYVAGYTVANDLSARDRGRRAECAATSPFKMDWTKHKTFEGSCPLGPWIVPASDIGDPQNLGLKLWVNGELKQDSNTGKMMFTLAEQIEQLSVNMTLASRRPDPHRHPLRHRRRERRLPQGRRRGEALDRKDRRDRKPDDVTGPVAAAVSCRPSRAGQQENMAGFIVTPVARGAGLC